VTGGRGALGRTRCYVGMLTGEAAGAALMVDGPLPGVGVFPGVGVGSTGLPGVLTGGGVVAWPRQCDPYSDGVHEGAGDG
jgi:hypothetical protein